MVNLELEADEGIILQSKEIEFFGDIDNETDIMELILTNKNLICVDDKGWFKADIVIEKIPINSIKIVDNKPQIIETVSNIGDPAFQILLNNGQRKQVIFDRSDKKELKIWIGSIKNVINGINEVYSENNANTGPAFFEAEDSKTTTAVNTIENTKKAVPSENTQNTSKRKSLIGGLAGALGSLDIQSAVEKAQAKIAEFPQQMAEKLENLSYNDNATEEILPEQPIAQQASSENSNAKHVFCSNCGTKLNDGAKFCHGCGALTNNIVSGAETSTSPIQTETTVEKHKTEYKDEPITTRETVYEGEIRKCPNCGEIINAFTAKCPACGFELNSKKVSFVLQDFISKINDCEKSIANSHTSGKSGWSSWSKSKRFWWVVLNFFFVCIPLVIYLALPLVTVKSTPKLSTEEKRMVSLIENFPFPNDRESILSALVFAKEKIDFISKETINRKTAYWMRLWCAKAEQLKQKADMLFPNDPIVRKSFNEIIADETHVNKIMKIKAVVGLILLIASILFFFVRNGTFDDIQVANTVVEIPETELSVLMPQIEGGKGEIVTNNNEYFTVNYVGISSSEFESYKKECKDNGFTIDCENTGSLFDAYNEDGYNIRITYYDSKMHITVKDDLEMRTIVWPKSKVADLLPKPESDYGNISSSSDSCLIIYVGNMTIEDYAEYVNACIKNGFDKDMSQTDEHYHADNKDGYHVQVEYRGFNTVFIRIDD